MTRQAEKNRRAPLDASSFNATDGAPWIISHSVRNILALASIWAGRENSPLVDPKGRYIGILDMLIEGLEGGNRRNGINDMDVETYLQKLVEYRRACSEADWSDGDQFRTLIDDAEILRQGISH